MKKKSIIAILLVIVLCFSCCSCGKSEKPIELTEVQIDGVKYSIPAGWEKKTVDTSGALTLQHIYYPTLEDTSNSIDIKVLKADNEIYTIDQAEHYVGVFMDSFYSKAQGYETVECEKYSGADVPSKYGIYTMDSSVGKLTITSYCFLMNSDEIFLISYWHLESSDEDYGSTFEECIKTVEILSPEFYYTDGDSDAYNSNNNDSAAYDANDPYYSENDHNNDGQISGDEFQDAVNDYVDDMMNGDSASYDANDPYYSENDHNNDGQISGDEFQDAVNDYVNDMMY